MSLVIHLLGSPVVEGAAAPKGRKAWALLAYLLAAERPVTRTELAALLFAEAEDPLAALRWNLLEVRRLLQDPDALRGEALALTLSEDAYVDVHVLQRAPWPEASRVPGLGRELLEGMSFASAPAFEAWLLNERRHQKATSEAVLREAALFRLSAGDGPAAVDLALRLLSLEPLDEMHHALLIRAHRAAGDEAAAEQHREACTELLRRELGVEPGPLIANLPAAEPASPHLVHGPDRASASALLESGAAALRAGALDRGIETLEAAVSAARRGGDVALEARARFAMGSALMHSGRNRYEEASLVLHDVIRLSHQLNDHMLRAASLRELAWAELLAARYARIQPLLDEACGLADGDPSELSAITFVRGMALTEVSRYGDSIAELRRSTELAKQAGDMQRAGLSLSMLGKAMVLRRETEPARTTLTEALEVFRANGWTWLVAWPEAYLAELELVHGKTDTAESLFEHAFTLARETGDPCFTSKSEAGLGLVAAARGDHTEAIGRLTGARHRLIDTPDHTWTLGTVIDALASVAIAAGMPEAAVWVDELEDVSGKAGMRELLVRAYLHRHALGQTSALAAAEVLARDIDNPFLHETIASSASGKPRRIPA